MTIFRCALVASTLALHLQAADRVFEPFEGDGFGTWQETGKAFGKAPATGGHGTQAGKVRGYAGESFASSFAEGAAGMGSLTSPPFAIEHPHLSFLIGGGSKKGLTSIQLLIDDQIMREATGQDDSILRSRTWDVSNLKGQQGRLRLVDAAAREGDYILIDHILFAEKSDPGFPDATRDGRPFNPGLVSTDTLPGVTIPEGSRLEIFATHDEHDLYSPTALCIDESGRVLVTETHRLRHGIPDNRDHRYWHTDDIAALSVEDRHRMHQKWDENYPVAAMTEKSEKIRLLVDTDGDGEADRSTLYAEGFNGMLDGTAGGIYSLEGQVYFACIPHIWTLRDTDDDGIADVRKKLFSGFGLRVSLSGHDLNGFALGADGRLYGSVGDRAMNVTNREGLHFAYTDQGTVFRFDPDGTNFEVVHAGLRNPKEIAFDQWGNLISVDNNSDQGDRARVVYIVDGADSGWRTDHQNLHTFHREVGYPRRPINQWMQERQWDKHHEGQPAFLLPPIDVLTSGPSGLTYQPGTGFSTNCENSFLVCDYRGGPAASGIWAFQLEPRGAGLKMVNARKFNWGAAVTDVEFGYDGRLYVADFVKGWQSHSAGRIYTLSSEESLTSTKTREVTELFAGKNFNRLPPLQLFELMKHEDFRVRLRAQLALADRPEAVPYFINATRQEESRSLALHGTWGLWIRARRAQSKASTERLVELLGHPDNELRAQAARALGEAPLEDHGRLVNSLQDPSPRVRAFAATSLARHRAKGAFNPTLVLLAENADHDPYLRHAGVMALLGSGTEAQIAALNSHPNKSIRLAAVVALRRLRSPNLVRFFFDKEDPLISDEAIRAAHDVPIEMARPAVAALLDEYAPGQGGRPLSRMMLRRLLHSAFRVGGTENATRLLRVAANTALDENERLEALRLVSVWTNPPAVDQSLGRYAPLDPRNQSEIKEALELEIESLLSLKGEVLAAAIGLAGQYGLSVKGLDAASLTSLLEARELGSRVRMVVLDLLAAGDPAALHELLDTATRDADIAYANHALGLLASRFPQSAIPVVTKTLDSNNVVQAQAAWKILANLPGEAAAARIARGLHELETGKLNPAIALEVVEAGEKRKDDPAVTLAFKNYGNSLSKDDPLADFQICLQGGNPVNGEAVFRSNPAGQCLRCHRVDNGHSEGGEAGPNLAGIGKRHDARYFLESLILPNAVVTPGFGVVSLTFKNGKSKSGILSSENADTIELLEGMDLWRIKKSDIRERSKPVSAMAPPMGAVLTKRELRDLVAWLGSLTRNNPPAPPGRSPTDLDPDTLPVKTSRNGTGTPQPTVAESPPPNETGDPKKTPGPSPETTPTPATASDRKPDGESRTTIEISIDSRQMKLGKKTYLTCLACHGDRGQGVAGQGGPPLAPSEWVVGPVENLIRIQIRGLRDNITVNHRHYTLGVDINPAGMIPLSQTNEQIAAVLTYIRNSWGNRASAVTPGMVEKYRAESGQPPLKITDLVAPPPLPESATETPGSGPPTSGPAAGTDEIRRVFIILGILTWCSLCVIPVIRRIKAQNRAGR
ncbi:MAG: hypothetical protein QF405_12205 [Roseibacillus sp.]|nr:hypothetical protein [Roseibacillus sp.]MDP7308391.1 hypothetical protein [Roseibacillus sp.]|tara:strand:+ start:18728 stop:23362 length:4635 start_codon:yes stop_codon:yes gene_type:complete